MQRNKRFVYILTLLTHFFYYLFKKTSVKSKYEYAKIQPQCHLDFKRHFRFTGGLVSCCNYTCYNLTCKLHMTQCAKIIVGMIANF